MASALLEKYGNAVESLALIPSGSGVYEVMKNDNLIFSKKAEERFPELDEIIESLEKPV
jgi:selenoprotein W-related protein